jgi:hypothetical protein
MSDSLHRFRKGDLFRAGSLDFPHYIKWMNRKPAVSFRRPVVDAILSHRPPVVTTHADLAGFRSSENAPARTEETRLPEGPDRALEKCFYLFGADCGVDAA